jgi:hypothetical protein
MRTIQPFPTLTMPIPFSPKPMNSASPRQCSSPPSALCRPTTCDNPARGRTPNEVNSFQKTTESLGPRPNYRYWTVWARVRPARPTATRRGGRGLSLAGAAGALRPPLGSCRFLIDYRGWRCAQPPATLWHPFRMRTNDRRANAVRPTFPVGIS